MTNSSQTKASVFVPYSEVPLGQGRLIYVSGQITRDPVLVSVSDQTRELFGRIAEILKHAGAEFESIVRVNAYLTDLRDYDEYNDVRRELWAGKKLPASTSVGVGHLMNSFNKIEIDVIAYGA